MTLVTLLTNQGTPSGQTITLNRLESTAQTFNPTVILNASFAITLNRLESTAQVFLPTVIQAGGTQTITLDRLESTAQVFNPTVIRQASSIISLNRLESTAQVFLPTVIQTAGVQTITLNLLGSTAQIFLPTINLQGAVTDTSDILTRGLRKLRRQEEELAAQILKKKRKPEYKETKQTNWKELLLRQINGAETVEELDAIDIPTEEPDITAKVLALVERRKEAKRLELEVAEKEAQVKILELRAQAEQQEAEYVQRLNDQRVAVIAAKKLQEEVLARHALAVEQAIRIEQEAFLAQYKADQEAAEFTRKRNNRIKRLKALMWLAKLDL